jgi:hypothetical protein
VVAQQVAPSWRSFAQECDATSPYDQIRVSFRRDIKLPAQLFIQLRQVKVLFWFRAIGEQ